MALNKSKIFKFLTLLIYFIIFFILIPFVVEVIIFEYIQFSPIQNLYYFWGGITVSESMPDHALVIVDEEEYYPPFEEYAIEIGIYSQDRKYFDINIIPDEKIMRARKARENYNPNNKAKGNFQGHSQVFTTYFLRRLGILPELESRWNEDGTWNW